ncbi:manganese catalase family protein [Salegentibacter sp. F188]|jgi:Mn-containing catalase|uniref:Manganese catalase family protein n=1 Tax=Autumnicola patrickiae TaxID=3075591 RepID=A0ABU3E6L8_9FLAO|nr:manganese catalase family protein [Salegentibacter sp. F188]MDT0691641.1 manganese catalase family protein [Salegentibacter sp. F188]
MFYHVKELQFNARVSKPDPAFATLLLEQFGGANGELKAALQYFTQAFAAKKVHPDKYDLLMDIATEEFSHLEIVGATIQMLLKGVHGSLKDAADESEIMPLMQGTASKEEFIHQAMVNPQFFNLSGGGPTLTDSNGNPWTSAYVTANGDLTVDLRSNIAAESRAKIVYEYLLQHTNDPHVKETLRFLMTREVAHFQMFQAALETIEPNFPPGVLQSDPRYSNKYFNLSNGEDVRGPWNEGKSPELGETWEYISDPIEHVKRTKGMVDGEQTSSRTQKEVDKKNKELSKKKAKEIEKALPDKGEMQWSKY